MKTSLFSSLVFAPLSLIIACGAHDDQIPSSLVGTWKSPEGAMLVFGADNDVAFKDAPDVSSCETKWFELDGQPSFDAAQFTLDGTGVWKDDTTPCGGSVTTTNASINELTITYEQTGDALSVTVSRCAQRAFEGSPCPFEMTRQQ